METEVNCTVSEILAQPYGLTEAEERIFGKVSAKLDGLAAILADIGVCASADPEAGKLEGSD